MQQVLTAGQRAARALLDGGTEEAARRWGVAHSNVRQVSPIRERTPDIFRLLEEGAVGVGKAYAMMRARPEGKPAWEKRAAPPRRMAVPGDPERGERSGKAAYRTRRAPRAAGHSALYHALQALSELAAGAPAGALLSDYPPEWGANLALTLPAAREFLAALAAAVEGGGAPSDRAPARHQAEKERTET